MEQADQLLKAGDIAGARAVLVQAVREHPGDAGARMFLFQLFLIMGEWDKADAQLRALAQAEPEARMLAAAYGRAIAAERMRAQAFAGAVPVAPLLTAGGWLQSLCAALTQACADADPRTEALLAEARSAAPQAAGRWNGLDFEGLLDSDVRFGPSLEMIVGGRWGLVGFDELVSLHSEGPKDLRDLVWLPVEMTFRMGRSAAGFLPVRYPGTEASADSQLRLSRSTIWKDGALGPEGLGQRLFFAGQDGEFALLSLRDLVTNP